MECEDIPIFQSSTKQLLLLKHLLSFLYWYNSNNNFFAFVIPRYVQCCLSPEIAETAFLQFLSPLCLRQLFVSLLLLGELLFASCQSVVPEVRLVPLYTTLITRALSSAIQTENHSGSHLTETNLRRQVIIFSTEWNWIPFPTNHLGNEVVSGLYSVDKLQLTCLNMKPHIIRYCCRSGVLIYG